MYQYEKTNNVGVRHKKTDIRERSGSGRVLAPEIEGLQVRVSPASLHCVLEQDTLILA